MKSFFAIASLVAVAVAQRLTILSPGPETTIQRGSTFIAELHQDNAQGSLSEVSVTISLNSCHDSCYDPSIWSGSTVLYNGAFNPQYNSSTPQKGLYQDFPFTLSADWPQGGHVLQVAHLSKLGAVGELTFDYTEVHVTVQ